MSEKKVIKSLKDLKTFVIRAGVLVLQMPPVDRSKQGGRVT